MARSHHGAVLRSELDPDGKHGQRKIHSALVAMGLDPDDVDPASSKDGLEVNEMVPSDHVPIIREQRTVVWEGLRQSRVQKITEKMSGLTADEVRRYGQVSPGSGVRPVVDADIPPAKEMVGLGDFEELQRKKLKQNQAEQQRKANQICSAFLTQKKRLDNADAQAAQLDARLKAKKAEQDAELKVRREMLAKKTQKRIDGSKRAAEARSEWEDTFEQEMEIKMSEANSKRTFRYSTLNLAEKQEAAEQKRQEAFYQAKMSEEALVQRISDRTDSVAQRLEERRERIEDELAVRAEDRSKKFQAKQLVVFTNAQDFVDKKLSEHATFLDKFETAKAAGLAEVKQRSKSCGELTKKATAKWQVNHAKLKVDRQEGNAAILAKHQEGSERVEAQSHMKIKCGGDVHTFREIKHGTWRELHRKNFEALQKSRDAISQVQVFKVAEQNAKASHMWDGTRELERRRQQIAKDTLKFRNEAQEGFIKIKCEPNEERIRQRMASLGFEMPKIPTEDEPVEEEAKPAY